MPETDHAFGAAFAQGTVTLATVPGGTSVLDTLPADAFENLLVVAAGPSIRTIEAAVEAHGGDPSKVGVVPVTGTPISGDTPLWTARRVDPSDLTGISIEVSRGMQYVKAGTGWVVIDSASVLSMYARPERLIRLLSSIASATRDADARCVIAVSEAVLDDKTFASIAGIADEQTTYD